VTSSPSSSASLPVLVLAAGLGTRLDPITRIVAKPAVPLAGRTLIERVLTHLRQSGVGQVVINLHHRPETIAAVVGDGAHLGVRVRYSWEQPVLGSAGGPRHALPLLERDRFFIVNGDTLAEIDLAGLAAAHAASGAAVTMAVAPHPDHGRYGGVVLDGFDRVVAFVPAGRANGSWHFVGTQVTDAEVFAAVADGVPAETTAGIYRDMVARQPGRVRGWRVTAPALDVGTPRAYLDAALRLAGESVVVEPGAIVDPDARVRASVVWPGARIGPHVDLDGCVVAGRVSIPARFSARAAVLVPESLALPTDDVERREGVAVFPMAG
jgi:NDP-sugar pyrophosphorylase family protein